MSRSAFPPASLELLPGESLRPPLRLLEPRRGAVTPVGPAARRSQRRQSGWRWLERLRRLAAGMC